MPLFYDLDGFGEDTARVAGRLAALRQAMQHHSEIPEQCVTNKNATDTLLLATWNLKEFDGGDADKRTESKQNCTIGKRDLRVENWVSVVLARTGC